jgi:Fe-S-cluster-containing dehydrogenase component
VPSLNIVIDELGGLNTMSESKLELGEQGDEEVQRAENNILKKPVTRRTVVAAAGGTIAGLVVGGFLGSWGVTSSSIASGKVSILATPLKLIVTNRSRCSGCQRCEMMCSLRNDGHVSQLTSRVKVSRNYFFGKSTSGPDGAYHNMQWIVEHCKQCADPWCAKFCPTHAIISSEKTGTRFVDTKACIGCGMCHAACPWNMPTIDPQIGKSTKCISCGRCAEQCPNAAILFVDWEDIANKVLESGEVSTARLFVQ